MFQSAKYQHLRDEVHSLDRIVNSLSYRISGAIDKLECIEKKIPIDHTEHIQHFKDEVYGELFEIKRSLFDLQKDAIVRESQNPVKLEDLPENEWDRLIDIVKDTYPWHVLDARSIIIQRFNKLKNG